MSLLRRSANVKNIFVPAEVACTVREKLDGKEVAEATAKGGEKSDICVENTGKVNEYLRVRLVSHFVDAKGNVTGAQPSVYPDITLRQGWIAGKEHTYYYTEAVEPGGFTSVLCDPFPLSEETLSDGTAVFQVVQVFAECIQAEPTDAVRQSWGVTVTNGTVTAVQ